METACRHLVEKGQLVFHSDKEAYTVVPGSRVPHPPRGKGYYKRLTKQPELTNPIGKESDLYQTPSPQQNRRTFNRRHKRPKRCIISDEDDTDVDELRISNSEDDETEDQVPSWSVFRGSSRQSVSDMECSDVDVVNDDAVPSTTKTDPGIPNGPSNEPENSVQQDSDNVSQEPRKAVKIQSATCFEAKRV